MKTSEEVIKVIEAKGGKLTCEEIYTNGVFSNLKGKTPIFTLRNTLLAMTHRGEISIDLAKPNKWYISEGNVSPQRKKQIVAENASEIKVSVIKGKDANFIFHEHDVPVKALPEIYKFCCELSGVEFKHKIEGTPGLSDDEILKLHGKKFPEHIALYYL